MTSTQKISYKVFLFERVKKKIRFFNADSYPLQIRLTAGKRTIYLKSNFFNLLRLVKYQQQPFAMKPIAVADIICREQALLDFVLGKAQDNLSLDTIRRQYHYFSQDILHLLDEEFKKFLVVFFRESNLPAYSLLLQHQGDDYTSSFIMHNLQQSLHPAVLDNLLQTSVKKAPPYIPFLQFLQYTNHDFLPLFAVYQWQPPVVQQFTLFVSKHFPAYYSTQPANYITSLLKNVSPDR